MENVDFVEDDIIDLIDWSEFFHELPEGTNALELELEPPSIGESSSVEILSNPSPDSFSSWINEIESVLMKDDDDADEKDSPEPSDDSCERFLADVLVDSHGEEPSAVDAAIDVDSNASACDDEFDSSQKEKVDAVKIDDRENVDANDPISKKRRRQLRNRDAAVKSRERKKMYVRDLEIKNKFLEGECRRLERFLQCYYAENQALRFSLQMGCASGASLTKQESAVLLLESLLLGSLLWLVGIVCLFNLRVPKIPESTLELVQQLIIRTEDPRNGGGNKNPTNYTLSVQSYQQTRRCRAARSRIKPADHHSSGFIEPVLVLWFVLESY